MPFHATQSGRSSSGPGPFTGPSATATPHRPMSAGSVSRAQRRSGTFSAGCRDPGSPRTPGADARQRRRALTQVVAGRSDRRHAAQAFVLCGAA